MFLYFPGENQKIFRKETKSEKSEIQETDKLKSCTGDGIHLVQRPWPYGYGG